jgi:5-methyltetrahydrofolate--homocysteine methyltransferase
MLTKEEFQKKISGGLCFLDGATGSNLRKAGMPNGVCTEEWVLNHPEVLVSLQRRYAESGSQSIYAPTFQAQPIALKTVGLD